MAKTDRVGDRAARAPAASEAQVHLEMDRASFDVLTELMDVLEASSISEVIRRAIQAHEVVDPDFDEPLSSVEDSPTEHRSKDIKTLHVRLPARTKARLDKEKARIKGTYSDVIIRSIMILDQLVHDREKLLNGESHGNGNDQPHNPGHDPDRPASRKDGRPKVGYSAQLLPA